MKIHIHRSLYPLLALIVILFLVELFAPKPIDWTRSFMYDDTRPYGTKILYELLDTELFPNQELKLNNQTVFQYLDNVNTSKLHNLILIGDNLNFRKWDIEKIIPWIQKGNNMLIASNQLGDLVDTLGFVVKKDYSINKIKMDSLVQYFKNKKIKNQNGFVYKKSYDPVRIEIKDKNKIYVEGVSKTKSVQFINIPIDKGKIILSVQPLAFTNYNMLQKDNADYVAGIFSYFPDYPLVFNSYYNYENLYGKKNILSFILTNKALRLAYYLTVIAILLLLLFQGKRKQRIIPIIKPLPNTSLNFIKTLGQLYFKYSNHIDIAKKQIIYFKEYIKNRYNLTFVKENVEEIADRSGISVKIIKFLDYKINQIENAKSIDGNTLKLLNDKIEFFYNNCK